MARLRSSENQLLQRGRSYSLRITRALLDAAFEAIAASTRPQLFAADHCSFHHRGVNGYPASTRPQLFAADHTGITLGRRPVKNLLQRGRSYSLRITSSYRQNPASMAPCFNEAAAIRCGSRMSQAEAARTVHVLQRGRSYSLRITGATPRVARWPAACFNEAAAIRCGSRRQCPLIARSPSCFNEAAAIRCGSQEQPHPLFLAATLLQRGRSYSLRITPDLHDLRLYRGSASTRPQLFAADHRGGRTNTSRGASSFNEAAAIRCGSRPIAAGSSLSSPASTRPQLFAADHAADQPEVAMSTVTLQRGRSYSLRITLLPRQCPISEGSASTRPQLFAADQLRCASGDRSALAASTRPQLFAADHELI